MPNAISSQIHRFDCPRRGRKKRKVKTDVPPISQRLVSALCQKNAIKGKKSGENQAGPCSGVSMQGVLSLFCGWSPSWTLLNGVNANRDERGQERVRSYEWEWECVGMGTRIDSLKWGEWESIFLYRPQVQNISGWWWDQASKKKRGGGDRQGKR